MTGELWPPMRWDEFVHYLGTQLALCGSIEGLLGFDDPTMKLPAKAPA